MRALSSFHREFRARLGAAGLNQKRFGQIVGASDSKISRVLSGKIRLQEKETATWADALGLSGDQRDEFLDWVSVFCAPKRVQTLVQAQRAEIRRLEEIALECRRKMERARQALGQGETQAPARPA